MIDNPDEYDHIFFGCLGQYIATRFHIDSDEPTDMEIFEVCHQRPWHWSEARDAITSPIELRLFAHLLFANDGYKLFNFDDYAYPPNWVGTVLDVQSQIGRYRADFHLTIRVGELRDLIVIECDGHDFHERTKEQAARDKARDRFFTTSGIKTLRYTGSEIFRNAKKCADEISTFCADARRGLELHAGIA